MPNTDVVELKHFTEEHTQQLCTFELPMEQGQFTSLPKNYLEITEGQHRIVIVHHLVPVGFFLLHATERVKEYTDNPNAMLLTSLSINHKEQGKGYARHAMNILRRFVLEEFPNCNEIILAVNHKNIAAQRLYAKVGFQDTGKRKMGPIGEQFILNFMLS
ncbi:GNAT family N-acetyltransferase [Ornithinibacillus scapharcae]|uniref:GNAT family N-acetyltransferase n=1 Tax=Ornithinibacillus scapharcae TaxID=1147159 RepID=UPI000225AE16|nr:GNAT family N-acetyltransferase [Ornithinibacillus scapharcae]